MDEQFFELLISKLDDLSQGQTRIETSLSKRLDEHNEIFAQHLKDDKNLADHIIRVDKEVTFAKGVTYAVNTVSAGVAWFVGWGKS